MEDVVGTTGGCLEDVGGCVEDVVGTTGGCMEDVVGTTGGCVQDVIGTTAEGRKADGGVGSSMGDTVGMRVGKCEDDSSADCGREAALTLRLVHMTLRAGRQFRQCFPIFWQEQPLHRPLPLHLQQVPGISNSG